MKVSNCLKSRANHANTLVIVMGVVVVLGIALASVLRLVSQENRILARTSTWNSALPVAEAGIEEAMSHLWAVDGGYRAVNNWIQSGSNFVATRYTGNGRYVVGISSDVTPVIISVGQVWCPSASRYIQRRIEVQTKGQSIFQKGLVARNKIKMSGQFFADSFDSVDPAYNTNGLYAPSKRKDRGDVATNLSTPDAIDVSGQVTIYGNVGTGPSGTIKIGDSTKSSIGTTNFVDSGSTGIQAGHHATDMNVSFPDVTEPFVGGVTPISLTLGGIFYKYVLYTGNYTLSSLSLSSSDRVLVLGNANLLVEQDVTISGKAYIQIEPGANLQLYIRRGKLSITGSGVANKTGSASNFAVWGMPDMKDISVSGNGEFIGTLYAPQAKLSMSGSGTDYMDFMGAAIVNEVSGTGNYRFHYDESLAYYTSKNLIITSWKEV